MFTGIVREMGRVNRIEKKGGIVLITISSKEVVRGLNIGDSVAVSGVCLTAVKTAGSAITFDVMEETVRRSTLAHLKEGDTVNLEGSMGVDGVFGGHFVQGHIDCVGTIRHINKKGDSFSIDIGVPDGFSGLYVNKGSVAIDGISLTIGECKGNGFDVYIIPHTLKSTTLGLKAPGDKINVEFDVIGKYIAKTTSHSGNGTNLSNSFPGMGQASPRVTEKFLEDKGFI